MTAADGTVTGSPLTATITAGGRPVRTVLSLAMIEAVFFVRNVLVLSGLVAGLVAVWAWFWLNPVQPLWWWADWRIGAGQLLLAMAVLPAAQLAAGRARRDGMAGLYASFPATAGTRAVAHLAGAAGLLPATVLLAGAGALLVRLREPVGTPSLLVLLAGVVLVLAAGVAGAALGIRFSHPLAGLIGALALFLPTATAAILPGWTTWLVPWHLFPDELGWLPGPLPGYPPAGPHLAYLASGAALVALAALTLTVRAARSRGLLAAGAAVAAAVLCLTGVLQARPVPVTELNQLAARMASPDPAQRCTVAGQVRYCLFPDFGSDLPQIEAPVQDVLALLPARAGSLTVQQALAIDFTDSHLVFGYPPRQVHRWTGQVKDGPGNVAIASVISLTVGQWPASANLTDADFLVALATAEWVVGFPASNWPDQCVPLDQAREAITLWAAILTARPPAGSLQSSLNRNGSLITPPLETGHTLVSPWSYPTTLDSVATAGPQLTVPGYLLAKAMTGLPEQRVRQVLASQWATWLNPRTTDAQLAAALGIAMPAVPAAVALPGQPYAPQPVCGA